MSAVKQQSNDAPATSGFLVGRYDYAMDPKRRFTIPATWRDLMRKPDSVYIMPDPHLPCLNLIPPGEMEARLDKLRQRALFDKSAGQAYRIIGENAEQVSVDVQGRIRIKDKLLQFARIEETVVMIGALNRIQIWSLSLRPEEKTVDQATLAEACETLLF